MMDEILALNAKQWERERIIREFLEEIEDYEQEQQ